VVPSLSFLAHLFGDDATRNLVNIFPKTRLEMLVWLGLATNAGFCQELIFRGYLTRQFSALTGSSIIAILLQGIVFGLSHGYYGKFMIAIMVEGCLLGLLAYWRKSLLPGMLAHTLQDGIGVLIAFFTWA
jgi:hypothetical protein